MADNNGTDVLMQLRFDNGPLEAECQTEVDSDDDPFVSDYDNGTFFEVKEFSFGMNIDDKDPKTDSVNAGSQPFATPQGARGLHGLGDGRLTPAQIAAIAAATKKESKFGRWKSASPSDLQSMKCYPVRMDEVSIKRDYDKASPVLFRQCCLSGAFKSASLIKRKDVGGSKLRGFLRMEFNDVLITHLEWEDGDTIEESFRFVFRSVTIKYRITLLRKGQNEASLQSLPDVEWSYDRELVNRKASLPL